MTSGELFAAADRVTPSPATRAAAAGTDDRCSSLATGGPAGGAGSGDLELAPPVRSELARALASLVFRCVPEGASA